jgi:hypothetical protein
MIPIATHRNYFVAVTQEGGGPDCFGWELRHRKTPMGVKARVHGFRSPEAAEVAGKTALAEFLEGRGIVGCLNRKGGQKISASGSKLAKIQKVNAGAC